MYKITPELLREVAGAPVNKKVVDGLVEYLPEALEKYGINTKLRLAHFLAQIAHESDHFRTLEEYASGAAYEGRRDLGNVVRGDGRRYKGRGAIQLTGRFNYRKFGKILGVNLEENPELAATPEISVLTALEYWKQRKLNDWADEDNGKQITRLINGGYNGLKDRLEKVERAKRALRDIEIIDVVPVKIETSKVTSAPAPKTVKKAETKPTKRQDIPTDAIDVPASNSLPAFTQGDGVHNTLIEDTE